ncbi:MAG TPA: LL-diaminopimelate aminotransferase [Candidatus Omnitrophota bacterium]|nr:LL-diaminopimelate aminotransferase [Candidatus Omnitrophota bacterium]HQO58053.1 LL-diaminopimelate aminotransferase [Candidatus Omnitrophota bacterium]HQP12077.1 LL-diaminopimelate aminotransferase [Candidatus Omnitrophota bacterium]
MTNTIEWADRLKELPPYLFIDIDKAKRKAIAEGRDVINLGIGDPDLPPFPHIIAAMKAALDNPGNHHYAFDAGLPDLRQAIAEWFQARFQVSLDRDTEIYPLIGSKEGLAHLPLGIINPNDKVWITDPAYPAYQASVLFAGGKITRIPLKESQNFMPDISKLPSAKGVKAMFVNYPNNPTATCATKQFYQQLVEFALANNIILISDMAYSEIYYDGVKPVSILEVKGAKDIAIEFHSLSKTYNMTGWRIGWACGNPRLIAALAKVKSNYDSGIFQAIQVAGISALQTPPEEIDDLRRLYEERRDCLINGLRSVGWKIQPPAAAFYVWAKIPKCFQDSMQAAQTFLDRADIVATPGVGFGPAGEGYIRMALTVPKDRLAEAVSRIQKIL